MIPELVYGYILAELGESAANQFKETFNGNGGFSDCDDSFLVEIKGKIRLIINSRAINDKDRELEQYHEAICSYFNLRKLTKKQIMKTINNSLPQYWAVKNDGSQLFQDTVIKDLNNLHDGSYFYGINDDWFYGYDGSSSYNRAGISCWYSLGCFENNPVALSLEEYCELRGEKVTETVSVEDLKKIHSKHKEYLDNIKDNMRIYAEKDQDTTHHEECARILAHVLSDIDKLIQNKTF